MSIERFVKEALAEDIGRGDLFYATASPKQGGCAILAKEAGVLCGIPYAKALAKECALEVMFGIDEGEWFEKDARLAEVRGDIRDMLRAERVLLNMLQHASGIATNVRSYLKALEGSSLKLLDTRKTRPLLREFEKYASRCGGAHNHRFGLDDALMIKDTHKALISEDIREYIKRARRSIPFTAKIEIECASREEAYAAMEAGADIIMCDNMAVAAIKDVVDYRESRGFAALLEASGNITKENIGLYIESGVDAISSGSIIHQARWIDLSMKCDG